MKWNYIPCVLCVWLLLLRIIFLFFFESLFLLFMYFDYIPSAFHPINFNFWIFLINFKENFSLLFTILYMCIMTYDHLYSSFLPLTPPMSYFQKILSNLHLSFFDNPWSLVSSAHTLMAWCHPWEHRKPTDSIFSSNSSSLSSLAAIHCQ